MKILRVAAVFALVALPFILASVREEKPTTVPEYGEDDSLFDEELVAD